MSATIGIIAPPGRQGRDVARGVTERGGVAHLLDLTLEEKPPVVLTASSAQWDGVDLLALDRIYLHGFVHENPVIPECAELTEWSVWQAGYLMRQQAYSFLHSLLTELVRRGVEVVNGPVAHLRNFMKFAFLEEVRRAGFLVPDLMSTNDGEEAAGFAASGAPVVWRTGSGRAAWQRFTEKQRLALVDGGKPPILLARVAEGPLETAFLAGGRRLLRLQRKGPLYEPPMESLEWFWHVPEEGPQGALEKLSRHFGLGFCQVFYVSSKAGPVIYDVEADPILDWLPGEHRDYLLTALAGYLVTGQEFQPPPVPDALHTPKERPNFFLRRMMKILFQFEESKYNEPK